MANYWFTKGYIIGKIMMGIEWKYHDGSFHYGYPTTNMVYNGETVPWGCMLGETISPTSAPTSHIWGHLGTVSLTSTIIFWRYPRMGIPQKWMVYSGKCHKKGWFGGTLILGNLHLSRVRSLQFIQMKWSQQRRSTESVRVANFCIATVGSHSSTRKMDNVAIMKFGYPLVNWHDYGKSPLFNG